MAAALPSAKEVVLKLILELNRPFYIARFIDGFFNIPPEHQEGLSEFLSNHVEYDQIKDLHRERRFLDVIKIVIFLYSGREKMNELAIIDLKRLICEYVESPIFKEKESYIEVGGDEGLSQILQEMEAI